MKSKNCKNCGACKRVYCTIWFGFYKIDRFYCSERDNVLTDFNGCERWRKQKNRYDLSAQRFNDAVSDIQFILNLPCVNDDSL